MTVGHGTIQHGCRVGEASSRPEAKGCPVAAHFAVRYRHPSSPSSQITLSARHFTTSTPLNASSPARSVPSTPRNGCSTCRNDVSTGRNALSTPRTALSTPQSAISTSRTAISTARNDPSTAQNVASSLTTDRPEPSSWHSDLSPAFSGPSSGCSKTATGHPFMPAWHYDCPLAIPKQTTSLLPLSVNQNSQQKG